MHTYSIQLKKPIAGRKNNYWSSAKPPFSQNIGLARSIISKHGWSATSYQTMNPHMKLWFSTTNDAVAGYTVQNKVRAVAGIPVCDRKEIKKVVQEFEDDADMAGEKVCYFGSELTPEDISLKQSHSVIQLGMQPSWSPDNWGTMLSRRASVRAQLNRARNKNISVFEYFYGNNQLHMKTNQCLKEWLSARGLPPLGFLAEPQIINSLFDRRLFLACKNSEVIAYLVASPLPRRNGWLIEQNIRGAKAPNGTTELLIDAAMRIFAAEGSDYVTLGLAPLSTRQTKDNMINPLWIRFLFAGIRSYGEHFYNFGGIDAFKAKFSPQQWEPVFAISNEQSFSFSTLYALASAFSMGNPVKIILRSILAAKN